MEAEFPRVLEAARLGEEWAWRLIYRDMAPPVMGYLRARAGGEAEDLLGEVFLQVVRNLPGFEGDRSALRAWIFLIAQHRLIDQQRRRARQTAVPASPELLEARGPTGDVEAEGLAAMDVSEVRKVIADLTSDQQTVLLLRILGDLTVEETGRVLGKRSGAVKALQRRALAAVKSRLSEGAVPL